MELFQRFAALADEKTGDLSKAIKALAGASAKLGQVRTLTSGRFNAVLQVERIIALNVGSCSKNLLYVLHKTRWAILAGMMGLVLCASGVGVVLSFSIGTVGDFVVLAAEVAGLWCEVQAIRDIAAATNDLQSLEDLKKLVGNAHAAAIRVREDAIRAREQAGATVPRLSAPKLDDAAKQALELTMSSADALTQSAKELVLAAETMPRLQRSSRAAAAFCDRNARLTECVLASECLRVWAIGCGGLGTSWTGRPRQAVMLE